MITRTSMALLISCAALALTGCGHGGSAQHAAGPPPVSSSRTSTAAGEQSAHVGIPECAPGARSTPANNPRCGHRPLTRKRVHRRKRAHIQAHGR